MLISTPRAPRTPPASSSGQLMAFCGGDHGRVFARRRGCAHHRVAHAEHDGADIGEVAIDQARRGDNVADALHGLAQNIVGDAKRFKETGAFGDQVQQADRWEW